MAEVDTYGEAEYFYIKLGEGEVESTYEWSDQILIDLDEKRRPVGVEFIGFGPLAVADNLWLEGFKAGFLTARTTLNEDDIERGKEIARRHGLEVDEDLS